LPTYSPATNQFTLTGANVAYDANGNLLTDNLYSYTWDPNFGNPSSVTNQMGGNDSVYGLVYDALGRMVEQDDSFRECAIHICITSTPSQGQIVYGPDGQKLALASAQNLAKAFIQLPGGGAAIYDSSGLDYYRHADWQGSSRLTSTQGRAIYSISAYAPFGEQYAVTDTSDPSFTGQNSDTVSGLYDFLYRENSSSQGRWISPDPSGLSAADPNNPQSWNRYAYVANNPLSNIDRMGLDDSSIDGCANKNVDCVPGILDGISVLASDPAPTHVPFDPQNTANVNGGEGAIVPQQLFGLLFPNGIQSAANNGNFSWRGAFAKNLFSWKNFTDEFKQGGCVNVAVNATAGALNPFSPSLATAGEGTAGVLAASQYNAAVQYAASAPNYLGGTGLIYPMKSSVVRGMIADANATAASAPLFALDGALLQGVITEGISMANGECH
jgi:RHS repeat-associated protein